MHLCGKAMHVVCQSRHDRELQLFHTDQLETRTSS
jgi:hypothetical protein